jgi:hypothetical protein
MADKQAGNRRITVLLPKELRERLTTLSMSPGSGKTAIVMHVIREHLKTHLEHGGLERGISKNSAEITVVDTQSVDSPVLVLPAPHLTIGVFGEPTNEPSRIEVISNLAAAFAGHIIQNFEDLSKLTPEQLEELVAERFGKRGYVVERVGHVYKADGGIDIVFWSKSGAEVPIQGAIQVKHHKKPSTRTGVKVVREMEGILNRHRGAFNMGLVVTNTFFTHEAQAWIQAPNAFLRLHDGNDVLKWVRGNFVNDDEVTNLPDSISLTTKLLMELTRKKPES